jgi:hypothetical protein
MREMDAGKGTEKGRSEKARLQEGKGGAKRGRLRQSELKQKG